MPLAAELLADFLVCMRFCSRLPLPILGFEQAPHDFAGFARAVRMLPLAGAALGSLAGLVPTIASSLGFPPPIAAALAIGTMVLLTGALHEDGLADCADGFGGGKTREHKLDIMRDSRIGTYGAIAIALTLYLRVESVAALATKSPALAGVALIAAAAVSRTAALVPLILLPPARTDGSGQSAGRPGGRAFAIALCGAALSALVPVLTGADLRATLVGIAATAAVTIGATGLAHRQIGGHSGDVAGAVQQLSELTILLAYVAG